MAIHRLSAQAKLRRARSARAGFSLIELMIASFVLTIAVCGVSGSMLSALALNRVNRETALAHEAVRRVMEEAHGVPFNELFARYNASAADNPAGVSPGRNFAVFGLEPQAGDADGFVGEVTFPTTVVGGVEQLREDVVDAGLGMPRDLNGITIPGDELLNHALDYRVLPMRVRVSWRGVSGERTLAAECMLSGR